MRGVRSSEIKNGYSQAGKIISVILAISVLFTGCQDNKAAPKPPTSRVLKAAIATGAPVIDGKADDAFWRQAKPLTVDAGGPELTMKMAVSGDMIYTLLSWNDATNDNIDEVWEFDGTTWKKGPIDDAVAMFWNIGGSIKGFDKKGCRIVCHQGDHPPTMAIDGPLTPDGKLWPGIKQRGDIWDMSLAISNVRGAGNDYYFSVEKTYLKHPSTLQPVIKSRHDDFTAKAPLELNEVIVGNEKMGVPRWRLKPGLTVENAPYPQLDQVEEISDYSIFRAGDRIPYIIFHPLDTPWGGSRDDLKAKGIWQDGRWTVEFARKLNTGHNDDIRFKATPGETRYYVFDVAVFDRSIVKHTSTGPISLEITGK
jgi:hypothetical protein